MKLIKLTNTAMGPVWLNPEHLALVTVVDTNVVLHMVNEHPTKSDGTGGGHVTIRVQEPIEAVLVKLEDSNKQPINPRFVASPSHNRKLSR